MQYIIDEIEWLLDSKTFPFAYLQFVMLYSAI